MTPQQQNVVAVIGVPYSSKSSLSQALLCYKPRSAGTMIAPELQPLRQQQQNAEHAYSQQYLLASVTSFVKADLGSFANTFCKV